MMEQKFIDIEKKYRNTNTPISSQEVEKFYKMMRLEFTLNITDRLRRAGKVIPEDHLPVIIEKMVDEWLVQLQQQNKELIHGTSDMEETPVGLLQ